MAKATRNFQFLKIQRRYGWSTLQGGEPERAWGASLQGTRSLQHRSYSQDNRQYRRQKKFSSSVIKASLLARTMASIDAERNSQVVHENNSLPQQLIFP